MPLAVHGAPIDADVIVVLVMNVSARGHLGQFSGNGRVDILLTLSAMKGRECSTQSMAARQIAGP